MLATRRWVGLSLVAVLLIVAFGALSYWQWQRAQRDQLAALEPVVATSVLGPQLLVDSDYGRRVTLTGTYDAAQQVVVDHGDGAYWVVTPMLVSGSASLVPVVRGTVSSLDDPAVAAVPPGQVTVVGTAQPFEGDPGGTSSAAPGTVERLTAAALTYDHVGGWVALESSTPAQQPPMAEVVAPFGGDGTSGLRLQNAGYAVQWVLFAFFVVFIWGRMLREDLRDAQTQEPAPQKSPSGPEIY
jgi:cytochrome oxidase assembly protein ShyY1